jgi:hypothetical protein
MGTEDGRVTGNLTIEDRARAGRVWIAACPYLAGGV